MVARSGMFVAPVPGTTPVGMAPIDGRLAFSAVIGTVAQLASGGAVTQSASLMTYAVAAAVWQLPDATNAAATFLSATDAVTLTGTAGPGTGSRIDIIVVKQNNIENGDADSRVNVTLVAGVAGSPGVAPATPSGAYLYASIAVPTSAANSSACTVTIPRPTKYAPMEIQSTTLALLNTVTGATGQTAIVTTDTNNNGLYFWNATAWKAAGSGLQLMTPSSVSGTGVSLTGAAVVFAGSSAISVNGCFTTAYDNYVIKINVTSKTAAGGMTMVLRVGGVDNTAASYFTQVLSGSGSTTTSAQSVSQTTWLPYALATATLNTLEVEMFGPMLAQYTMGVTKNHERILSSGAGAITMGDIYHGVVATFDGFTLSLTAGTGGGSLRVYGFNN